MSNSEVINSVDLTCTDIGNIHLRGSSPKEDVGCDIGVRKGVGGCGNKGEVLSENLLGISGQVDWLVVIADVDLMITPTGVVV